MQILFFESFYGGSHRDVADALVEYSRHRIDLRTLPARFWKWRMRGAGLHFAHEIADPSRYDLVVCTGLMSVADLFAVRRDGWPPILLYAHETQLAYPAPRERESDLHFAFTDLANMISVDHVAFNSQTHRSAYLEALPRFLRRLPEYRPMWALEQVREKSSYCHPGIRVRIPSTDERPEDVRPASLREPPLVVWNHRWEFDKDPQAFFTALRSVKALGVRFSLALLGENFQVVPKPFLAAQKEFADEIVHFGYVADRAGYEQWLSRADVVVSTAIQENFGISVMEAIAHGAYPLLPRRLSYPEIIPSEYHACLYADHDELVRKLASALTHDRNEPARRAVLTGLQTHARSFAWEHRIRAFEALFERVAGTARADEGVR